MSRNQAQAVGRHILLGDDAGAQFQPALWPVGAAGAEFQAEGLTGPGHDNRPAHRGIDLAVLGMEPGRASRRATGSPSCAGKPSISGGFRRQGEKLGAEIQIEHALMRRADRGQRQIGERRVGIERIAFRRGLGFQSRAALEPCRKGSTAISSLAITASASRIAPAAAKPPVAAGRGEAFAQAAQRRSPPPPAPPARRRRRWARSPAPPCMPRRPQIDQIEPRPPALPGTIAMSVRSVAPGRPR